MPGSHPIRLPEDEVILIAARDNIAGLEGQLRHAASRIGDWARVERYAAWHGVVPLLYHHLSKLAPASVPADVLGRFHEEFTVNSRRALVQAGELLSLIQSLRDRGISAIPFKGPVAANLLYSRPGLRVAGDIDVVIRPEDAVAAREALVFLGYRYGPELTPRQDAEYRKYAPGYVLNSAHHRIIVDLQWDVSPKRFSFRLPMDVFRSRLHPVSIHGNEVLTFAPNDMLLVLCIHGSKHVWESLKWLVDVSELLKRNPTLDVDSVLQDASRAGCRRATLLGLLLCARLLSAPVPESVRELAESERAVTWMADRIQERMFQTAPGREGKYRIEMRLEDSVLNKLRFILRCALTPASDEWMAGNIGMVSHARRPFQLLRFLVQRKMKRETKSVEP